MNKFIPVHLENTSQLPFPKIIRDILDIKSKNDIIGFDINGKQVTLTKTTTIPVEIPLTEKEWQKLINIRKQKGSKTFKNGSKFLEYHKKLCKI